MDSSKEIDSYNYKTTINTGFNKKVFIRFSDGNGNYDDNYGTYYSFGSGVYGFSNKEIKRINSNNNINIDSVDISCNIPQIENSRVGISFNYSNNIQNIYYKIRAIKSDGTIEELFNSFDDEDYSWFPNKGEYNIVIEVSDDSGNYDSRVIPLSVVSGEPLSLDSVEIDNEDNLIINSPINFHINASKGLGDYRYKLIIKAGNYNESTIIESNEKDISFTPESEGTYSYTIIVKDSTGEIRVKSGTIYVYNDTNNFVTIYYSGYDNPNIHYKIGDGNWTNIPGIKMSTSTKYEGYPYEITINLADSNTLTACFNDGYGNWDSNNGANYIFQKGEYKYSNGKIINLNSKNTVTIYYKGYSNPNIHYKIGNGEWTSVPGISMTKSSELEGYEYKITIDLENENNLTACFNDGYGNWDNNYGNNYVFSSGVYTFNNGIITSI